MVNRQSRADRDVNGHSHHFTIISAQNRFDYFGVTVDFLPFIVDDEYQVGEISVDKSVREE